MQEFKINSASVAHMATQVRAKQLATRDSQYKVLASIVKTWEENHPDKSGEAIGKQIVQDLEKFHNISKSLNDHLKAEDVNKIGYPIKFNKTNLQLEMSLEYAKQQESDNLIGQIKNCHFYNNQYCYVDSTELPVLRADNSDSYWGNENSSVSSVLLASINVSLGNKDINMPGAATFFPFYNSKYTLPKTFTKDYDSSDENGMMLFGDYQFGGHRYLKYQFIFGPEDCSSSVGKATGLATEQIKTITTREMRENYSQYGYELVTELKSIDEHQLKLIQPGDIYLRGTHTAIIATLPDNESNITTLQFARDIEYATEKKISGGGLYNYNLSEQLKGHYSNPIYILRAENSKPLDEEVSSLDFLNKIDNAYTKLYPNGPDEDVIGDCSQFFEDFE
ncbi:MAG TPA: hypothetical protein LFV66_00205 [Rickettsia endosymbiont of Bembidion lapponicum]|nr:hypothetical protein [Rickettsia endosymbiont of Bembidion lapponicum]